MQRLQRAAVIAFGARRIRGDDDGVSGLESIALDARLPKLPGAAPFQRPALKCAVLVGNIYL